jgi:hypothetical protein
MSNSMIDETVKVRDLGGGAREYTVSGQLGDQDAQQQGPDSVPDILIRVMIFQTVRDIGGSETKTHAFAMSEATLITVPTDRGDQHRWTATMQHRPFTRHIPPQSLEEFNLDHGATGLAVSVDCTDDQPGFKIFTWSGPIRFELDPTASPA